MARYIFTLRRGRKETDENGVITRDDWVAYEESPNYMKPLEGELVLEYDNGVPRLKIGDGVNDFDELEYLSVDSFILPKQISVTLYGSEDTDNADKPQWTEETDEEGNFLGRYKQVVEIDNAVITANSKVDLNPTPEMLAIFHEKDVTFVAENDNCVVTVYCVGQKPQNTYTKIPVTVTEMITTDKVVGNTTATPNPQSDWEEDDETKAGYIKNKPELGDFATAQSVTDALQEAKVYTDNEIATFDFIKVMDALPETGLTNKIYLVPKPDTQTQDLFDEYIYVNKGTEEAPEYVWEWITTKQLAVDLMNYVQKDGDKVLSTNDYTTEDKNKLDGIPSDTQTQLNGKQATITGGASTITSSNLTASRALVSNGSGKVAVSDVTSTELGYLDGVTSNIQTQFTNINNNLVIGTQPSDLLATVEGLSNGIFFFRLNGTTSSDLPSVSNIQYSSAVAFKRGTGAALYVWGNSSCPRTYKRYYNGSTWGNWISLDNLYTIDFKITIASNLVDSLNKLIIAYYLNGELKTTTLSFTSTSLTQSLTVDQGSFIAFASNKTFGTLDIPQCVDRSSSSIVVNMFSSALKLTNKKYYLVEGSGSASIRFA